MAQVFVENPASGRHLAILVLLNKVIKVSEILTQRVEIRQACFPAFYLLQELISLLMAKNLASSHRIDEMDTAVTLQMTRKGLLIPRKALGDLGWARKNWRLCGKRK
jgi:hypothetical protein